MQFQTIQALMNRRYFLCLNLFQKKISVQKSLKKTCGFDLTLTPLVIAWLEVLLPVITKTINSPLLGGHFLTMSKEALVDPRFKNAGINNFNNLGPMSNLLYVTKLCLIRCMLTCPICDSLHTDKVIIRRQHFLRHTIVTLRHRRRKRRRRLTAP